MNSELWGWKTRWQINCAGTVLLVDGLHVPGASSGRSAGKPPGNEKRSNYLRTLSSLVFISQVTFESWEGFTLLKLFCLSKNKSGFLFPPVFLCICRCQGKQFRPAFLRVSTAFHVPTFCFHLGRCMVVFWIYQTADHSTIICGRDPSS